MEIQDLRSKIKTFFIPKFHHRWRFKRRCHFTQMSFPKRKKRFFFLQTLMQKATIKICQQLYNNFILRCFNSRNDFFPSSDILVTQQNTQRQKCVWSHNKTLSILIRGNENQPKSVSSNKFLSSKKKIFQTTNLKFGNWLEFSISAGKMNHFWQMAKFEFVVANCTLSN